MLCECGKREATVHEVVIHKGVRHEIHLCEKCAAERGLSADPHLPISDLIESLGKGLAKAKTEAGEASQTAARCAGCGTTFAGFKESGLLGCPACYDAFEDRLGPLIERAHEGACSHVGKFPKRALTEVHGEGGPGRIEVLLGDRREREERLEALRRKLAKAVRDEDYERAAMLRDELTRMGNLLADSPSGSDEG